MEAFPITHDLSAAETTNSLFRSNVQMLLAEIWALISCFTEAVVERRTQNHISSHRIYLGVGIRGDRSPFRRLRL